MQNTDHNAELAGRAPRGYHPENIEGKAVVVTGATTGIGRAIAQMLVERGARVFIFGPDTESLQDTLDSFQSLGEIHGVVADQANPDDVRRLFQEADDKIGGIDILVNNAGVYATGVLDMEIEAIQNVLETNLLGYMACTHEAMTRMKQRGSGHIVCIGSLSANVREPEHDVYVATKAGIQAWCQSLRRLVNKTHNIKVSLIEPGLVESGLTVGTEEDAPHSPEEARKMQEESTMLHPSDIAEAVHYCLTQPKRCEIMTLQISPHRQAV